MIRLITNALASFKAALGITSPSREILAAARAAEHRPYVPPAPLPWYAARGPGEPWSSAELAAAARRVRRLIRRHWWALAFDYDGNVAMVVRRAMATPPKLVQPVDVYQQLRELLDAGKLELRPEYAHKFYEDAFGRTEQSATAALVVPAEQCPNCAHVETECQCGDLRDCW